MEYSIPWGSSHPGLLVYLIDMSESMGRNKRMEQVSNTIWNVVDSLIASCQTQPNQYSDRFHLEIIGYNSEVHHLFSGSVSDINDHLDATPDEQFVDITKEAKPQWQTYMADAFDEAASTIKNWIIKQKSLGKSIPAPIVINITDGKPEEGELTLEQAKEKALKAADRLKDISVPDGNVILFNIYIYGDGEQKLFPSESPAESNQAFLFNASSIMNGMFVTRAMHAKFPVTKSSRFVAYNISDNRLLSRLITFGSSLTGLGGNDAPEKPKPY